MKKHPVYVILAVDKNMGIGKEGKLAWHLPGDLEYFHKTTKSVSDKSKRNMIIMGDTTWKSLPKALRPMKGRKNVVLTTDDDFNVKSANIAHSLDEALGLADDQIEKIFIVGGAYTVKKAFEEGKVDAIYLTRVDKEYDVDAYFPDIPEEFDKETFLGGGEDCGVKYGFYLYERC